MEELSTVPEPQSPSAPAVPPTPPVPLSALLAREDLALRLIAGPAEPDTVIHWAHTSEMADPYPYLLGGELLLTAGVHVPAAAGPDAGTPGSDEADSSGDYFEGYVSRIVAAGGAALGFGLAPVHDTVPRALVAACDTHGLPLLEVPPRTTFSGVARAVWQLMAQARLAELRRVTEAQQSLAAAAARPDPVPAVLRQLAQRLGGWAALYGPEGTELAHAGRLPPSGPQEAARSANRAGPADPAHARTPSATEARPADTARPADAAPPPDPAPAGPARPTDTTRPADAAEPTRPANRVGPTDTTHPAPPTHPTTATHPTDTNHPADAAEATRPTNRVGPTDTPHPAPPTHPTTATHPTDTNHPADAAEPTPPANRAGPTDTTRPADAARLPQAAPKAGGHAGPTGVSGTSTSTGRTARSGAPTDPAHADPAPPPGAHAAGTPTTGPDSADALPVVPAPEVVLAELAGVVRPRGAQGPAPSSATDTVGGVHLAAYALGSGQGFVLGVATPRRDPGDHTIASVAAVLLSLLTGEHQSGSGAARSAALVRLLLGAAPETVAPLLGGERWVVVHARPAGDGPAPDAVSASALAAALGSALVDVGGDVVRVLVPGDREPTAQPGWTCGVSAPAGPHAWAAADTQAARALARARATRAPLVRHGDRPALADLVPPADAEAHAHALLAPVAGTPALTETLRTWLSLHGSWDRTAVALSVHRNTVRQRIARCAALLGADLDDPDVRMELWFALRDD
ncbi:helix-turn-helix domain-containing protein [Streptomyces sp. NPDC006290]|uniref:PucR family transcriptional regulator n=1 Tax=Streptomyces sp. NPDC006290 TaxID=3156745 RepID=UPI0033B37210